MGGSSAICRASASPTVKSSLLLSVSVSVDRAADVVLLVAGAGAVSRTTAVPYPTRSMMRVSAAQSAAVLHDQGRRRC